MRNKSLLLLAAALLTAGVASAQTTPNARPNAQGRTAPSQRVVYGNYQISPTLRSAAIDNESFVSQVGGGNFGVVTQNGDQQVADLVQVSAASTVRGNDGYQTQSNGAGANGNNISGRNDAYMAQYGDGNYGDQVQAGALNVAVTLQGRSNALRTENYSVQEQTGSNNYGYVSQESSNNFAHQRQTSSISTINGGGLPNSDNDNGNYAVTLQGGGAMAGTNGSNGQWSQTIQSGQNNRALVSQDH
ncbi:MAG: hypothetical protein EOO62_27655 [Hymenobacter sp.]|nr:MAG: hypothetical protein EOO62_27655 [Hymenobacter sp.]